MGKILATLGRFDESLALYSRTLEIDPGNRDAVRGYDSTEKNSRRWADLLPANTGQEKIIPPDTTVAHEVPLIETFSDPVYPEETGILKAVTHTMPPTTDSPQKSVAGDTICTPPVSVPESMARPVPELSIGSAMELAETADYQEAIEMLMKIVITRPKDVEPLIALAKVYETTGMYLDAASVCDRALKVEPKNAWLWGEKGKMFRIAGRYEAADAAYSASLGINSENPGILAERGDVCRKLGKYLEAEQSYRRSLELQPDAARVWYHRGKTLAMLKRYQEAIDACQLAISLDNSFIEAMTYKGFLLSKIQRYHDALDVFDTVLRIDPQCKDALRIRQSLIGKV